MGASQAIRTFIAMDPVVSFSCILSVIGLSLPIVVPPIRNSFSGSEPVAPPKLSEVVQGMTGKKN